VVLHAIARVKWMRQSKKSLSTDRASVRPSDIFQYQHMDPPGTSLVICHAARIQEGMNLFRNSSQMEKSLVLISMTYTVFELSIIER
jgi:hypothetical protein